MLEESILAELRTLFAELRSDYTLMMRPSAHDRQPELEALLTSFASTSPRLWLDSAGTPAPTVELALHRDGKPTGVTFRGVPGGHELSSLVLAILHADGKGRRPDDAFVARLRRLRGGALRTYVSLSCTNCPDVVQALNLIALENPAITHEMVDGELCQEEVRRLGIQGVPAVFAGDRLVHSGKSSLAELTEVLERTLGVEPEAAAPVPRRERYDVVVVGGGPAGAASAIYSARKGLRTAIIAQKLGGQVQETLGIENFIGVTYTEGPQLSSDLVRHLRRYDIEVLEHRVVERLEAGSPKVLSLKGGEVVTATSVVIATGARWRELGVPGEKEYLGRGVAFCPHCDGPFYKGRAVAVVGGGNSGVEAAIDLAGICSHVTLLEYADELKADAVLIAALKARPNVTVITAARTSAIDGDGQKVTGLRYDDRRSGEPHAVRLDGVFVQIGLSPNSAFVQDLVAVNRVGEIVVDDKGRTSVPGIYAAGDVTTTPFKQIVIAMGDGAKAALTAFEDRVRSAAA